MTSLKLFLILYYTKQIDSKLPYVCSVIDHRWRGRNKKVAHEARPSVSLILLLNIYRFENVHEFRRQWVNRCPSWQEDDVYKPTGHQYCEKTSTTQIADLIKI